MTWLWKLVNSSIGKKFLMGLTGLGLVGFLVAHLAGNLFVFAGPESYNAYGHKLDTFELLPLLELGLLTIFVVHIIVAAFLTWQNSAARPVHYEAPHAKGGRNTSNATMLPTGFVVLLFIVWHLFTFKFAHHPRDQLSRIDFHQMVLKTFSSTPVVIGYVLAVIVLGFHVRHGFQSAFRSVGFRHPKYTPGLEFLSIALAICFAVGYASIPVWAYLTKGG